MNLTRRGFVIGSGTVVATLPLAGCPSFSTIELDIEKYVPVGLQTFSSILGVLSEVGIVINPVLGLAITGVKAGFADLQVAIKNYESAPAADKTTLTGKIATALGDAEGMLQQFWNDLSIPDQKDETLIQSLLGVIVSVLSGFSAQFPAVKSVTALKPGKKVIPVTPKIVSVKQFKKNFNQVLIEAHKEKYAVR